MSFPVKQRVRVSVTTKDASLAFVDPTILTIKAKDPDGVETSHVFGTDLAVIRDSAGHFHMDFVLTDPGNWSFRVEGTGNMDVAKEVKEIADKSEFYS